ncbi:hypothetical protein J4Q44_G00241390 [Coregonus suidteri]|uniref:Nuclear/hormone receptor activator site AF-1 domain-containing protein n=1 Tax=Coregonus suidteri TaxID=861788 RepID=A0AAN8QGW0_9TELE
MHGKHNSEVLRPRLLQLTLLGPQFRLRAGHKDTCFMMTIGNSSGQVTSSPLGSPTSHRGMHPSLLSPSSMGPSGSLHSPISTLSSPMNGLGSPFSVINSPMGPHSMSSPGMGYGPSVSPQLNSQMNSVSSSEDIKPPLGLNGGDEGARPSPPRGACLSPSPNTSVPSAETAPQVNTMECTAVRAVKASSRGPVRKDLTYTCRDNKDCLIDKRQRNPLPVLPATRSVWLVE